MFVLGALPRDDDEVSVMHVSPLPLPLIIFILAVILFLLVTSRSNDPGASAHAGPRACHGCGATHPPHANFCRRCGHRLN
jgi:hypothetical protein